ncbi:hypothetical protein JTE90_006472 [Oedothorax gibbosus]|uniref:Uncharacterized protein n=1 Tax=Oedothorax gibbosus TaxID=931172 RepID=A0AAV6UHM2_9ARAC|nr:hypothetical protein JTE90_006472 [Oedothorax gibbosus]
MSEYPTLQTSPQSHASREVLGTVQWANEGCLQESRSSSWAMLEKSGVGGRTDEMKVFMASCRLMGVIDSARSNEVCERVEYLLTVDKITHRKNSSLLYRR